MIAYQVQLNGKSVATAGLKQGVISAQANWVFVPSDVSSDPDKDWAASFSLAGPDDTTHRHLDWFRARLKVGDEITLKLVEIDDVDSPARPLFEKSKEDVDGILDDEFERFQQREPGAAC